MPPFEVKDNTLFLTTNPSQPFREFGPGALAGREEHFQGLSLLRAFLPSRCLQSMEPVLLVGETGTGKTTVCQMAALMRGQRLHILNCNQHTETSDFLGGFRPTRHAFYTFPLLPYLAMLSGTSYLPNQA